MLSIKLHLNTLGDEIKMAILNNSRIKALEFNIKQSEKFLNYVNTWNNGKDKALVLKYAKKELHNLRNQLHNLRSQLTN